MNTNEVSKLVGISVRTLHHYDNVGILIPSRNLENEYREYNDSDIDKLQQILFFKECGFSLANIKDILDNPDFDRKRAFELQKKALLHEKKRIDSMLKTLDKSIQNMKGELVMSQKEKFDGFDFTNNPYEEEARKIWGNKVVDESNARISAMSKDEKDEVAKSMDGLFRELGKLKDESPSSETAQKAIDKMYKYFNNNFGYGYTLEAFANLGKMYVEDERFTKNIEKYGEGLSVFLTEAMKVYADAKK